MTGINYLDPTLYGPGKGGPQIAWLRWRLAVHGIIEPGHLMWNELWDEDLDQAYVRQFQLARGWTGRGADGLVGPKTLLLLSLAPEGETHRISRTNWKITNPDGSEVVQPEFELYH